MRETVGTYCHLVTDHFHYFEDGGLCYHTTFDTWENIRGQEYDPWKPTLHADLEKLRGIYDPRHYDFSSTARAGHKLQHAMNRAAMAEEAHFPLPRCFAAGFEFLDAARGRDDWLLQLECFDPHEPFHVPERFERRYDPGDRGLVLDWPAYARVTESEEEVRAIRAKYAALVAMCDDYLGRLLDRFDAEDLWANTALIATTDHGYLLSEHDWWAKVKMPHYQEIAHIPLMIHHPGMASQGGTRRRAVTSAIDILPTLAELHGAPIPPETRGQSLLPLLEADGPGHEVALSGVFGGPMLITDGDFAFHYRPRWLDSTNLYEYRLLPMHMRGPFSLQELRHMELVEPFAHTKGVQVLKIKARDDAKRVPNHDGEGFEDAATRLYDLRTDPGEAHPFRDPAIEARLLAAAARVMREHDAPQEMFERFALEAGRRA
ncbi:MAG: sulfatase-like hydrolase/transferase [Geminicoccaceae bacterium]